MANIQPEINDIRNAIYGEEVRGSICDALSAMNTETETFVNQAKSWAVGGTGTRQGEDTNNAKYWSEVAEASATDYTRVLETLGDEDISDVGTSVTNAINNLAEGGASVPEDVVLKGGEFEQTEGIPRDADLLDGHEADYFATSAALEQTNQNLSDYVSYDFTKEIKIGTVTRDSGTTNLYRRIIYKSNATNGTTIASLSSLGISSPSKILDMRAIGINVNNGTAISIPYTDSNSFFNIYVNTNSVMYATNGVSQHITLIIEYEK